jgi:hypothetical protein
VSSSEANGGTANKLYSSYFNKERFWFPDTEYFKANVTNSANAGKLISFVNLGQIPMSFIVRKLENVTGFNVTAKDWFGKGNVPEYIKEFDYISDYFVRIDVVQGDWTNYSQLSIDPVFSTYFNATGIIKSKMTSFLNAPDVKNIGSFEGSLIPDLIDGNGVNYSIDTIVNNALASTGLFVTLDRKALSEYDPTDTTSAGRVDMIGHTIINNTGLTAINFLSYNFAAKEYFDYPQTSSNTFSLYDFGTGATTNLPGGTGSTGASYSASANGYNANDPAKAIYFESFYGSGNEGKFNNRLVIRKEALSSAQQAEIAGLVAGSSILLDQVGGTYNAIITSINEVEESGYTKIKIGISHPAKAAEGTTSGKNAPVSSVSTSSSYIIVTGTVASAQINAGDWVLAEDSGVRYYFRTTAISATGSNTKITVDTTNFSGSTYLEEITTDYTVYWESVSGDSGSLLDVLDAYDTAHKGRVSASYQPDKFTYVSGGTGMSYYTSYEFNEAYQAFEDGILTTGDKAYVAGPVTLYLQPTFTRDSDNVKILNISAYLDSTLTTGYTGSWTFASITDSAGATLTSAALRAYSLVGDYNVTIGATGFDSTRTSLYIAAADEADAQVGQYLVADPLQTGDSVNFILTKITAKKKITTGTYNGYYQLTVAQPLPSAGTYATNVVRYKSIESAAPGYQFTYLPGFKITSYHLPGTAAQLARILGMLDSANSNLYDTLSDRHIISFRYIVDTFGGGLAAQSYPKNYLSKLAKNRQKCLAIINTPSIQEFIDSTDPRFTELPTDVNPKPILNTSYIAQGGNLSLGPSFMYSLPDEDNGAKFAGFFSPWLVIRDNNKNITIPPAADVSNNFIRKFIQGTPYAIAAGPRRGVLSNPRLVALEYDFIDRDREYLEPFGWNPIVFRKNVGFMIHANQTAYQKTLTAFNNLHVRDLLITLEETVEDILANYLFEFNDATTRLEIKSIVDKYLDNVRSAGGIYNFTTVMDSKNNTSETIDQNFAIIDIGVEPARGAQKFINRLTVLKTGAISSGGFTIV